jgi:hypothetical protein
MTHFVDHLSGWRTDDDTENLALTQEEWAIEGAMPDQKRVATLLERFRDTIGEIESPFAVDAMNSICHYVKSKFSYVLFFNYVMESERYSERVPSYVPFPGKKRENFIHPVWLDATFDILRTAPGIATQLVVKRSARPAEGAGYVLRINDTLGADLTHGITPTSSLEGKTIRPWGEQVISTSATPECNFGGWCFVITMPPGTPATCLALYRHQDSKWGGDEHEWLLPPNSTFLVGRVDARRYEIHVTYNGPLNKLPDKIPPDELYAKMRNTITHTFGGEAAYEKYEKLMADLEIKTNAMHRRQGLARKARDEAASQPPPPSPPPTKKKKGWHHEF